MYHCLLALFFRVGIKCENHSAAIILLNRVFSINNSEISKAKSDRIDRQYYVDFSVSKKETTDSIAVAEEFIANIADFIARLTEQDIIRFREVAIKLIRPKR